MKFQQFEYNNTLKKPKLTKMNSINYIKVTEYIIKTKKKKNTHTESRYTRCSKSGHLTILTKNSDCRHTVIGKIKISVSLFL